MLVHGDPNTPLLTTFLPALAGLAIYVGGAIFFVKDLYRPDRHVNVFEKDVWALIIVIGGLLGWAAYLLIGRDNS